MTKTSIFQQMVLSGTWDTTSSVYCRLITNYTVANYKWSVFVITALHARKDVAHLSEEKHKQDLLIPQKFLRMLADIYFNMKGHRPLDAGD